MAEPPEYWSLGYPAAARLPISEEAVDRNSVEPGTRVEEVFHDSDFEYVPQSGFVNLSRKEKGKTRKFVDWILHGARISAGNSGGPLITKDGTAVGINTLVQSIEKDRISNYFAPGMSQVGEILTENVPDAIPPRDDPNRDAR
jgi:Trypsin